MKKGGIILAVLLVILAFSTAIYSKKNPEMDDLFGGGDEASVIVVLKDDYSVIKNVQSYNNNFEAKKMMVSEQQKKTVSGLKLKKKEKSNDDYDFELTNSYTTVNGFAGRLKKSSYEKLKNDPNVALIYKPRNLTYFLFDSDKITNATRTWGLIYGAVNVTGKGESVCVIDSGVDYTHQALGGCSSGSFTAGTCQKVIGGYDFVNSDNDPIDDNGHGTHVAGIVASTNETYRGIAPDASIVAIKMLDSSGNGNTQNLISAIDWCVNNASRFNISVITMSLGTSEIFSSSCDSSDQLVADSIHAAIGRNISVIAAAGNAGSMSQVSDPACISNVTAVGSTTKNDVVSAFSNRWGLPMLFAPGSNITSLKSSQISCLNGCTCSGVFMTCSGTSMATPMVAGSFALLHQYRKLEQNAVLTPLQIQNALNSTGKAVDDTSNSGFFFQRINIFSALLSLDTIIPGINLVAPSPLNGTNLSLNSSGIYFNATSSEVPASAIIEVDNISKTNSTMNLNGLNFFINLTSLKIGVRSFKIYTNDSAGNSNNTDLVIFGINNTAPNISAYSPNTDFVNISEPSNQTFSVNFSDRENDTITFSWFVNNSLRLSGANKSEFNFTGNFSSAGVYPVNVTLTDGAAAAYRSWILTVNDTNQVPTITSANLTNSDFLNRTNGTLQAVFGFFDADGDQLVSNETLWYVNKTLNQNYTNMTSIQPSNTTKLENWTFSVRVFDGRNWSGFANSSTIKILNSNPSINITPESLTILETQLANFSLNASDMDNDQLVFSSNDSNFAVSNNALLWHTNLTSSGVYTLNISVSDGTGADFVISNVTVIYARDLDGDGNPDFNDTDIDNDGIPNAIDFLEGNISMLNTTTAINLTINGSSNLSRIFNGTYVINITNGSDEIMDFNFTFNSSDTLDLGNLTINRSTNGSGALSISGNLNLFATKTFFIDKINTTAKAVCIKDADASIADISSACDSSNETLLVCDNTSSGQYTCLDTGPRYKITGLSHSAVKEQCRDADGDGYGTGCLLGSDCNDNDASKTTSCPSGNSGNSGGGSSGGGGGGATAGYVCNMDWKCDDWSLCLNGKQTRQCSFVKVPQHVQESECADELTVPNMTMVCQFEKSASLINETRPLASEKLIVQENNKNSTISAPTKKPANAKAISWPAVTIGLIVVGLAGYYFLGNRANKFKKNSSKQK